MVLLARRTLAPRPGAAETVPAIPHNLGCSSPSAYAPRKEAGAFDFVSDLLGSEKKK